MWERVRTNYRMKCYPKAVNQTGQHSPCAEWCTTKSKKLTLASWSQLSMWTKIQDIVAYLEGKAEGSMARGRRVPRQFTSSAGQRGCKRNSNRWRPTSQLDWRRLSTPSMYWVVYCRWLSSSYLLQLTESKRIRNDSALLWPFRTADPIAVAHAVCHSTCLYAVRAL